MSDKEYRFTREQLESAAAEIYKRWGLHSSRVLKDVEAARDVLLRHAQEVKGDGQVAQLVAALREVGTLCTLEEIERNNCASCRLILERCPWLADPQASPDAQAIANQEQAQGDPSGLTVPEGASPGAGPHWEEANVTINGRQLTFAQSMALRVAVTAFQMDLLGEMGEGLGAIREGYQARIDEILRLLLVVEGAAGPEPATRKLALSEIPGSLLNDGITEVEVVTEVAHGGVPTDAAAEKSPSISSPQAPAESPLCAECKRPQSDPGHTWLAMNAHEFVPAESPGPAGEDLREEALKMLEDYQFTCTTSSNPAHYYADFAAAFASRKVEPVESQRDASDELVSQYQQRNSELERKAAAAEQAAAQARKERDDAIKAAIHGTAEAGCSFITHVAAEARSAAFKEMEPWLKHDKNCDGLKDKPVDIANGKGIYKWVNAGKPCTCGLAQAIEGGAAASSLRQRG